MRSVITPRVIVRAVAGLIAATAIFASSQAFAALPPHVPTSQSTDSCAICHRVHTANTDQSYVATGSALDTGTALLIAPDSTSGDVSLCFQCHGVGQLGSNIDVQSAFSGSSVHTLAPAPSAYGRTPVYCSTCHDAHGTERRGDGSTFPALLRAQAVASSTPVMTGEAVCGTCHTVASARDNDERWSGLGVYMTTAHYSGIATPTSGTGIRCSRCHDPHGSNVAPLLVGSIVPTSAASTMATTAVTADDRTFCAPCHPTAEGSWEGTATYEVSAHGASATTIPVAARWVPAGASQRVGECQACHAPMGRDDGTGHAIAALLDAKGRVLCDRCHTAGGAASTDTSSEARPAESTATLLVSFAPSSGMPAPVAAYGRVGSGTGLTGPRQFPVADGGGPTAVGDIDGDGASEVVVASATDATLTVLHADALDGLSSVETTFALPDGVPAVAIAVADVVDTTVSYVDRPEIVVVNANGDLYLLDDVGVSTLQMTSGPHHIGSGPWGLAVGDVTGSSLADVVVTDRAGGTMSILTDGGSGSATLTTRAIGGAPVAPAIGELFASNTGNEIAVCDASDAAKAVRLIAGDGSTLGTYALTGSAGTPVASAIGDLLPASAGDELAVAFDDAGSGASSVMVVPQLGSPSSGLDAAAASELLSPAGANTSSLLAGDVDGDGHVELVAGDAGSWAPLATPVAPGARVLGASGTGDALLATQVLRGGGTELAGGAPALALGDLGAVLPSRHPIDAVAVSHSSTETATAARHVTCSDCHNSHRAKPTDAVTAAPAAQGPLMGAEGVAVSGSGASRALTGPVGSSTSYGVCYRCHSAYSATLGGNPDVAAQFDPANASVHAVEAPAADAADFPASTLVASADLSGTSVLYCTDCHGDYLAGAGQAKGVHESAAAPILAAPVLGAAPSDAGLLCYRCHRYGVYADGTSAEAQASGFATQTAPATYVELHPFHTGKGISCAACHVSHGSTVNGHLLREDIGYVSGAAHAGTCANGCHGGVAQEWAKPAL